MRNTEEVNIQRISPMLAVADMAETIQFYSEVLGFDPSMKSEQYSVIECNGCTIHLMLAADEKVLEAVKGHTDIYIEVDDVESLWAHAKAYSSEFKMKGLIEQPYGMKEFHVNDPNGCLVFVGQRV